ncbi:MAG: hypothetical protein HC900_01825 [Methylacidiphilales bacterium]|nr:hypothetical protein [Candidatus Methylacidiphilales bacterium]
MLRLMSIPLALLAGWLIYPILFPVPVEGFSTAIVSLGVHLAQGDLAAFDRLQPFNVEFFALSKLGAVLGVAGLVKALGIDGETALKLLVWGGEALLLVSTFVLVRRWSGASPLIAALAILLVPSMIENGFYYNENVVTAGLAALALVCFGARSLILAPLIGGALFGIGALIRPDIVLAGVTVPLLVVEQAGVTRRAVISLLAAAVGGAVTWFGSLHLMGASIFDVLRVGSHAFELWDRQDAYPRHLREIAIFFGLAGGLLATIGVVALIRQRAWLRLAILLVPIIVVNAMFAGNLWHSRQMLGLAPFAVALTAIGVMQILPSAATSRLGLWLRGAVAAAIALILLVPGRTAYDDGPRDLLGRIPGIIHWRDWQTGVAAEMATIRGVVETDRPGLRVVITDDWNPDRYVHFAIVQAGFHAQEPADIGPACVGIAEPFERGSQRLLHVRLHQSYLKDANALNRERFETMARPCLEAMAPVATVLVTSETILRVMRGEADATTLWPAKGGWAPSPICCSAAFPARSRPSPRRRRCRGARPDEPGLCGPGGRDPAATGRLGGARAYGG